MARETLPTAPMTRASGRLPASVSSFIGRTAELSAVSDALASNRLVTLAGPGGVGKTRVALVAVRAVGERLGHPVFIDLTRIPEGAPVALAVAEAVGLRLVEKDEAIDALHWWLDTGKPVLLVLDNAEHVIDEAAALVAELLEGAADCRVLVTSRQPLHIAGEHIVPVGPMLEEDAETLFWERALAVRPTLSNTLESRSASRELCARLDRLPLAVELAAARMSVMSPAEMLPLLERRLPALGSGSVTGPARHRSLRACIAASVDALSEHERAAFEACAVFAAPFDARAAAAVARASLEDLEDLVSRSLLQPSVDPMGHTAFRLLESLREFAREGLEAAGRLEEVQRRHLAWIGTEFGADRALSVMEHSRNAESVDRLPDLRAALDFAVVAAPAEGLRLMGATRELWFRNAQDEGTSRSLELLSRHPDPDEARAAGLIAASVCHTSRQETVAGNRLAVEALGLVDRNSPAAAAAHYFRAIAQCLAKDTDGSAESCRTALDVYTKLGDAAGRGRSVGILGMASVWAHRNVEAIGILDEALALAKDAEDFWAQGQILTYLGIAESNLGRAAVGRMRLLEGIDAFTRVRDIAIRAVALARLAALTVRRDPGAAARAAAATTRREGAGGRFHEIALADLAEVRSAGELLLGPHGFSEAWESGEKLSFAEAAAELRGVRGGPEPDELTPRELEVAELVRRGLGNASIARQLSLSARTVENHVAHAMLKLGLHSRAALAVWAAERGKTE
ncbi:LuxR C-terminal-related transcriptional regulator [Sinomonas sp. JGH33]|uniref:LuxR C-terminal-related transcriptional regulator n=1 Tax=Sinomonas terricola TaxID=3110330 RepID=A0ABU5TC24_9MICC|nr:LuxR C-terminal-related transcriptional regulator [Sinomonas sp. JGH33]MEA5457239.1 LuxR C-terminal-related transcriptional regulator [Sinomonas sp. JGH33]